MAYTNLEIKVFNKVLDVCYEDYSADAKGLAKTLDLPINTVKGVLDNGQVVGWVVGQVGGDCYIKARTEDFKQYLLDNFQDNLEPTTQRFYFKTHSQKQLTKIIKKGEK